MTHLIKSAIVRVLGLTSVLAVVGCNRLNEYVAPPPPEVTVTRPTVGDVVDYAEFTGSTRALAKVDLRARISGYLKSIEFEDGAYVEKGQRLFVIEREPFEMALASEKAKLRKAEAALALAEAEVKRTTPLVKRGALSEQELDIKVADRATAEADVGAAQAAVNQAEWNLTYTGITAPISGRIGRHMVDVGNLVQTQTTMLTTIESFEPIYAYFNVSESDVLRFMERQRTGERHSEEETVSLGLTEGDGFPFKGRLDYTESDVDPDTGTQQRRAVFENKDHKLIPGLFARVRVSLGKAESRLLVSERAIGADQRGSFVLVVNDQNVVEYRPVELGIAHNGKRVVSRGLAEGEWIVLNGLQRARPGAAVQPKRVEDVAKNEAIAQPGESADVAKPRQVSRSDTVTKAGG